MKGTLWSALLLGIGKEPPPLPVRDLAACSREDGGPLQRARGQVWHRVTVPTLPNSVAPLSLWSTGQMTCPACQGRACVHKEGAVSSIFGRLRVKGQTQTPQLKRGVPSVPLGLGRKRRAVSSCCWSADRGGARRSPFLSQPGGRWSSRGV